MAKDTETQHNTDTQTITEKQGTTGNDSTDLQAPGGNPDNRETVQNMGAPELRNAVIELLTIIDDSDDMNVVVTISDDGTVVVEAA
ncbi:hypothetical protein B8W69_02945 [Mycobacterium vulneris]|uniref:Uncharacterized protein n=1 Tax=Mycolicibacterium vulneris TaxID=547163 RepID=A0A1X2LDP5_9MYCO|nr:hypothetical protein [Mycolicibacterium vulneris]OSC32067.1 hypothetical protein B8W69_02945 [Mycolicibacterium vulneris]